MEGGCYLLKKAARSSRARVHLLKAVRNYTRKGKGGGVKGGVETAFHGRSHHENPVMTRKRADLRGKFAAPFGTGLRPPPLPRRGIRSFATLDILLIMTPHPFLPLIFRGCHFSKKKKKIIEGRKESNFPFRVSGEISESLSLWRGGRLNRAARKLGGMQERMGCKFRGENRKRSALQLRQPSN